MNFLNYILNIPKPKSRYSLYSALKVLMSNSEFSELKAAIYLIEKNQKQNL